MRCGLLLPPPPQRSSIPQTGARPFAPVQTACCLEAATYLHMPEGPSLQSACSQAVTQYHAVQHVLHLVLSLTWPAVGPPACAQPSAGQLGSWRPLDLRDLSSSLRWIVVQHHGKGHGDRTHYGS